MPPAALDVEATTRGRSTGRRGGAVRASERVEPPGAVGACGRRGAARNHPARASNTTSRHEERGRCFTWDDRVESTWKTLRAVFVAVPIAAGVDKFLHLLADWDVCT